MTDETNTNDKMAELILKQTYEERIWLASYLSTATQSGMEDGWTSNVFDASYYAELLAGWARVVEEDGASK